MAGYKRILGKILFCVGLALSFVAGAASAQSNSVIDQMLSQRAATVGDSAYIVLTAANVVAPDADVAQALSTAIDKGWLKKSAKADAPITFGQFSYLIMKSFNLRGGLLYTVFPGPRYAAREMFYRGYAPSRLSPYEKVSGTLALYVLRTMLDARGNS